MCMMSSLSYRPHIYSHQVWLTDAGRLIPRPILSSLTCTSAVSHQVVACITTVGGGLSECCSIEMTNSAVGSVIQRTTVYSCWIKVELLHDVHCIANVCYCQYTDRTPSAAWYLSPINRTLEPNDANSLSPLWGAQQQHTFTCWFTPRPHSSRLTCTSPVSHKVIPCVTTVGGSLIAMPSNNTRDAIGWGIWSSAWYICWMKTEVSKTRPSNPSAEDKTFFYQQATLTTHSSAKRDCPV